MAAILSVLTKLAQSEPKVRYVKSVDQCMTVLEQRIVLQRSLCIYSEDWSTKNKKLCGSVDHILYPGISNKHK